MKENVPWYFLLTGYKQLNLAFLRSYDTFLKVFLMITLHDFCTVAHKGHIDFFHRNLVSRKLFSYDRKLVSCGLKLLSCDRKLVSCDRTLVSCDRKLVSCDRKLLSSDRKLLSCDGKNRCVPYEPP